MKRPRVSIRFAMLVVVLTAVPLGLWGKKLSSLRASYREDAEYHARREREERHNVSVFDRGRRAGATNADEPSIVQLEQASRLGVAYHAGLKLKYRRAADRPWESVPPDPADVSENLVRQSRYVTLKPDEFPTARGK